MSKWGEVYRYDCEGYTYQICFAFGGQFGVVEQFAANAPTTYATVLLDQRLGAFNSWDAAKAAVERELEKRFSEA